MLDSKIGLWRVLSHFLTTAYINLSIPVPALAKKANAYLYHFCWGVGAFNFFPSETVKKCLFGLYKSLAFLFTKLLHNQSRMSEENVSFHRARKSNFFLYKLQWCEGERWGGPLTLGFSTRRRKRQLARPARRSSPSEEAEVGLTIALYGKGAEFSETERGEAPCERCIAPSSPRFVAFQPLQRWLKSRSVSFPVSRRKV